MPSSVAVSLTVDADPPAADPTPLPTRATPEPSESTPSDSFDIDGLGLVGCSRCGGGVGEGLIGLGNADSSLAPLNTLMARIDACGDAAGDRVFELEIDEHGDTLVTSFQRVDATAARCIQRVMTTLSPPPSWHVEASLTRPAGQPHTWAHAPR